MQLPFFGGSLPNLQMLRMVRIILLLLVLCSVFPLLFASESADNEIPGPESGYIYAGWQPDDRVMPIKWECEFIPDKAHYATGEILTVRVKIWVDKESRGYKADRTYYLGSEYVEGKQLNSFVPRLTWVILKSEIDTLEIMTDDRILEGDITMQLIRRGSKPQVKKSDSGVFLTLAPIDTTYTELGTYSGPPIINFKIYRIYQSGVSPDDRQLISKSGDFMYDLTDTINMYGKRFYDALKQYDRFNYNDKTNQPKDNIYVPEQPNFQETAMGGFWGNPIKVLKNSELRWRIANYNDNIHIMSVSFVGNAPGCTVSINPSCDYEYILTTGASLGYIEVRVSYRQGTTPYTASNMHTIINNYDYCGYVSYNNTGNMDYYHIAPFIGKIIMWGKNTGDTSYQVVDQVILSNSTNGFFSFNDITFPIIQIGFYVEYEAIPVIGFDPNPPVPGNNYYQYGNGIGFYHPESTWFWHNNQYILVNYLIALEEGEAPNNVVLPQYPDNRILLKDEMSCGALNILAQMKRMQSFWSSEHGTNIEFSNLDFVIMLDRIRDYLGNAYYEEGCSGFDDMSALSIRGVDIQGGEPISCWSNCTIMHELTHLVQDKVLNIPFLTNSTSSQAWYGLNIGNPTDVMRHISYIEGMATFYPAYIQSHTSYMFGDAHDNQGHRFVWYRGYNTQDIYQEKNLELGGVSNIPNSFPRYDYYYGSVACILWDLTDGCDDQYTTYNNDAVDFTLPEVYNMITGAGQGSIPQNLCQFLNRIYESPLVIDNAIENGFVDLLTARSIPISDYNHYRLSVGEGGQFHNINSAVDASCDGNMIVIDPGTYNEEVSIDKSIIIKGKSPVPDDVVVIGSLSIVGEQEVEITNLSITNPEGNGMSVGDSFLNLSRANISSCSGSGLYLEHPEKARVISSRITDNGESGIATSESQYQSIEDWGLIKRSLICDNANYGICSTTPLTIENCTISRNTYGVNNVNHLIYNSIIYENDYNISGSANAPNITYSCIDGGYTGEGNIDENPRFEDSSAGIYTLLWDYMGPSPCIDGGTTGTNNVNLDPDGTIPDMGCYHYPHATAEYVFDHEPGTRCIYWMCFPVVDDISNPEHQYWNELGYMFKNHTVLPSPQLRNIDWYYYGFEGRMDYTGQWNNSDYRVYPSQGYKVIFEGVPSVSNIDVIGFRFDPETTPILWKVTSNGQSVENWVGYFIPGTQNAWQALSKPVPNDPPGKRYLDYIYEIKAKKWSAIRIKPSASSPWIIEMGDYTLSEGDMISLRLLDGAPEEFFWNNTIACNPVERTDPSFFRVEENLDYTQVYVRLDPNDFPSEIGLYSNDICLGAAVVEDSLVQINLYSQETRNNDPLEIAFYYSGKGKSFRNDFLVYNHENMQFEATDLRASDIVDFAYISFVKDNGASEVPMVTSLEQNYPNPFNPETTITFNMADPHMAKLKIYNLKGQLVKTLVDSEMPKGKHKVIWNGTDRNGKVVGSGVYFYRLETGEYKKSFKMILIK